MIRTAWNIFLFTIGLGLGLCLFVFRLLARVFTPRKPGRFEEPDLIDKVLNDLDDLEPKPIGIPFPNINPDGGWALVRLRAIRTQATAELTRLGLPVTTEYVDTVTRKILLDAVQVSEQRVRESMQRKGKEATAEQIDEARAEFLEQFGIVEEKGEDLIDKAFREA